MLVELRPCSQGYYGIAQETRLIFGLLAALPEVRLGGLLNPAHDLPLVPEPRAPLPGRPAPGSLAEGPVGADLGAQAMLVAALTREIGGERRRRPWTRIERLLFGKHSGRSLLPWRSDRTAHALAPIDARHFRDFLWTTYFAKTLAAAQQPRIAAARFTVLRRGWLEAANGLAATGRAEALATAGWDVLLAQAGWPFALPPATRLLVRYHDAIPVLLPHTLSAKGVADEGRRHLAFLRAQLAGDAHFVCTSEPVRADLVALAPAAEARSSVIPDVVAPDFRPEPADAATLAQILALRREPSTAPAAEAPSAELARRPLVLAVSTLEPRKNHLRLLEAWRRLCRGVEAPAPLLVLVANPGWRCEDEQAEIRVMAAQGQLVHLARVPIAEMRLLYSAARAVACPSREEGFDLSGIEAMLCGAPVVASDIRAHRAGYGAAALYFDPLDVADLEARLRFVLDAPATLRATWRAAGLAQGRRYLPDAVAPHWQALIERLRGAPAPLPRPAPAVSA